METNTTVNTGIEVNPIKVCPFFVFAIPWVDTGNGTSIYTVSHALADVGDNGVCHSCWLYIGFNLVREPVDGVASRSLETLFSFFAIGTRLEITLSDLSLCMPARLLQECFFKT